LADEMAMLVCRVTAGFPNYQLNISKRLDFLTSADSYWIESKVIETEKVLNGFMRALRGGP
jgi:hypothetical protein